MDGNQSSFLEFWLFHLRMIRRIRGFRKHGASPEALWRALRPAESRWRNFSLKKLTSSDEHTLTDEQWMAYVAESEALQEKESAAEMCKEIHAKMKPIRGAVASQQLRSEMSRRLGYKQKRSAARDVALISDDRVICKNSQYTSKTGKGKFETKDGKVKEYRVVSINGGIVEVEEIGTGVKMLKHESNLKLMPKVMPADDNVIAVDVDEEDETIEGDIGEEVEEDNASKEVVGAKPCGSCLYRCLQMGQDHKAGLPACALVDDDAKAWKMRENVLQHQEKWIASLSKDKQALIVFWWLSIGVVWFHSFVIHLF